MSTAIVPQGIVELRTEAFRLAEALIRAADGRGEADKLQMEIEPLNAAQIEKLLATAYGTPKPIVQQAAELLEPPGQR